MLVKEAFKAHIHTYLMYKHQQQQKKNKTYKHFGSVNSWTSRVNRFSNDMFIHTIFSWVHTISLVFLFFFYFFRPKSIMNLEPLALFQMKRNAQNEVEQKEKWSRTKKKKKMKKKNTYEMNDQMKRKQTCIWKTYTFSAYNMYVSKPVSIFYQWKPNLKTKNRNFKKYKLLFEP